MKRKNRNHFAQRDEVAEIRAFLLITRFVESGKAILNETPLSTI